MALTGGDQEAVSEYLPAFANCDSIETIRAVVIYRIQEKFYGLHLSDKTMRTLDKAVADKLITLPLWVEQHGLLGIA